MIYSYGYKNAFLRPVNRGGGSPKTRFGGGGFMVGGTPPSLNKQIIYPFKQTNFHPLKRRSGY